MERFSIDSCVRGYHVYNDIWEASVSEELPCHHDYRSIWCSDQEERGACWAHTKENIKRHLCHSRLLVFNTSHVVRPSIVAGFRLAVWLAMPT